MNQLHPGARWLFRLHAYYPLFFGGLLIIIYSYQTFRIFFGYSFDLKFVMAILFYVLFVIIVAEIYAKMSYNRWFYEFNEEGLRLERGIIWKKYTSIPYERIQNVDIKRGIVARIFGFSTVEIETAGKSEMGRIHYGFTRFGRRRHRAYESEGHLPAIDIDGAEKIRELVIEKVKQTQKDNSNP